MKNILLTLGLIAANTAVNAQIYSPSINTTGNTTVRIDNLAFDVEDITPLGTINNGSDITFKGTLADGSGGYLNGFSGYTIGSQVEADTTASFSGGTLFFTGSVGLLTKPVHFAGSVPSIPYPGLNRTLEFYMSKSTFVIDGGSASQEISNIDAASGTVYYGIFDDTRESVLFKDAFTIDKDGRYVLDPKIKTTGKEVLYAYAKDSTTAKQLTEDGTGTAYYNFGVTLENTQTIPEPSSTALLGLGALALTIRRKR